MSYHRAMLVLAVALWAVLAWGGCVGRPQLVGPVPRVPRPIAEPQAITCRISGQAEPCLIVLKADWAALEPFCPVASDGGQYHAGMCLPFCTVCDSLLIERREVSWPA